MFFYKNTTLRSVFGFKLSLVLISLSSKENWQCGWVVLRLWEGKEVPTMCQALYSASRPNLTAKLDHCPTLLEKGSER